MTHGQVLELTPSLIAPLQVEVRLLETQGVEKHADAAALGGFFFRQCKEPCAKTLPSMAFVDPNGPDVEPLPEGLPQQAAANRSCIVSDEDRKRCMVVWSDNGRIMLLEAFANEIAILRTGFIFDGDLHHLICGRPYSTI